MGDKEFLCYQHIINKIARAELFIRSTAKVWSGYSIFQVAALHLRSASALLHPSLTHYSICQRWPLWPHLPSAQWQQPWKAAATMHRISFLTVASVPVDPLLDQASLLPHSWCLSVALCWPRHFYRIYKTPRHPTLSEARMVKRKSIQ